MKRDLPQHRDRSSVHLASRRLKRRRALLEKLEPRVVLAATPIISEFLASNAGGLLDEDGESSDWVEIYNPTGSAVDLDGWHLTDDSSDINKWTFPAVTIEPGEHLVVFASGKDRDVAGQQLHTSYRLSSDGEYLALAEPDQTVVSEFAPEYPRQIANVSYGYEFNSETLVGIGSSASTLVPSDNSLGDTWQQVGFNDAAWDAGTLGVGFGVEQLGFDVRYVKANVDIANLSAAETVLSTPAQQDFEINEFRTTINLHGTGDNGNFDGDAPFPGQTIGGDINHFVIEAVATVEIPSAGNWSFGVNSDDGFGLTLSRGANTYTSEFTGLRASANTIQTFFLPEAGSYDLRLVMFEGSGGATVELFAAQGALTTFSGAFRLVGDTASGGLSTSTSSADLIQTNVQTEMQGINSSIYVRTEFQVADPDDFDSLLLRMNYDDGFKAYLNGTEIVSRNAPNSLTFSSTASSARTEQEVATSEEIFLPPSAVDQLVSGTNVLSFHGLNHTAGDDSFLIAPELVGSKLLAGGPSYFTTPTPGEANQDPSLGLVEQVIADQDAGFRDTAFDLTLSSPTAGATIRYTTDGSEPTSTHGMVYNSPINISQTSVVRAIAYLPDHISLPAIARTFIFLDDVLQQSNNGSTPPGWPSDWGGNAVDYGIDPQVIAIEGAEQVKDALQAIPTWSISTDFDNLFDPDDGIYANARQEGRDWERPAAVELLNPDGSPGFQINAGLRIRGNFSRAETNPKHSFKLFFRSQYGDATLDYPVFGSEGVSEFKKLDLRTQQAFSWHIGNGFDLSTWITDVLARNTQRELDQPYTRSVWFHLYLNGQYWGLYQIQERADANFGASYFGGDAADFDSIKPEPGLNNAGDGNFDAYEELWLQALARDNDGVTPNFVNYDAYMRAQGKNPDGSDNPDYEVLLDVDNLIDYMLITLYIGNLDGPITNFGSNAFLNNYFTVRDRTSREGFRYLQHDTEVSLLEASVYSEFVLGEGAQVDRTGPWNHPNFESGVGFMNPQWLHQQLMANNEYRTRFGDRVQATFFNGGPLSIQAQQAMIDEETAKINLAIIAESARWGDAANGRQNNPILQSHFEDAIFALRNYLVPQREQVVLTQFRDANMVLKDGGGDYTVVVPAPLFPDLDAPQFLINGQRQHGGNIVSGSTLGFAADEMVYYTTDGTDPRLIGGGINPAASIYDPQSTTSTPLSSGSSWRYLDTGVNPGAGWKNEFFNDGAWASGNAELGYGDGGEATTVSFGGNANNKHITTYFRNDFTVNGSLGEIVSATVRLRRDDGAVVYINGVEAFRDNLTIWPIEPSTTATFAVGGADEVNFFDFTIDPALLKFGSNVIAVEIHQNSPTSSDISFDAEVVVVQQDNPTAATNFTEPTRIMARTRTAGGQWSALEQADFSVPLVPASASNLRITELNYNPYEPEGGLSPPLDDKENYEFIELKNISDDLISLEGVVFTDGIEFSFDDTATFALDPGEYVLVVKNLQAFEARYGTGLPVAGEFTSGGLNNGGEDLELTAADLSIIQQFEYDDTGAWPGRADQGGSSLEVIDLDGDYDDPDNWRASAEYGGSPGAAGLAGVQDVVVNEVMSHTDLPLVDSIELHNLTVANINIGGWYLSDSSSNYLKYRIPDDTILPAGGYLVFDENDFNPTPQTPGANDFALNGAEGDEVWLIETEENGGTDTIVRFVNHVDFGAQANAESWGRWPNGTGRLYPTLSTTLGAANSEPRVGPLVISEVMYNPPDPSTGFDANVYEYVEIFNPTFSTVDLTNWQLGGGLDFEFAPGTTLAPFQALIVTSFDPGDVANAAVVASFETVYGLGPNVNWVGGHTDGLDNGGETVRLYRPDDPPIDQPDFYPLLLEDEVRYDDSAPWPTSPDGGGDSLHRNAPDQWGNDPVSWNAAAPSPGISDIAGYANVVPGGRHLFYNASSFDGNGAGVDGPDDDSAIATDKEPLFSGQTADFDNYSSYIRGINGIMIDVEGLPGTPTASDFEFRVGNDDTTLDWPLLAVVPTVTVRPGAGVDGSDRIVITFPDGAITQQWLRVMMLANTETGLETPEVHYWGSQIGETGNSPGSTVVNSSDRSAVIANYTGFGPGSDVDSPYDINRDEVINSADRGAVIASYTGFGSRLQLITPQESAAAAPAAFSAILAMPTQQTARSDPDPEPQSVNLGETMGAMKRRIMLNRFGQPPERPNGRLPRRLSPAHEAVDTAPAPQTHRLHDLALMSVDISKWLRFVARRS